MKSSRKLVWMSLGLLSLSLAGCSDDEVLQPIEKADVSFSWVNMNVNVSENPQWSFSRSNHWVAMTNYAEKTQCYIEWHGDMAQGEKTDGQLKIAQNGAIPVTHKLKNLTLSSDGINCTLSFLSEDNYSGTFVFPL